MKHFLIIFSFLLLSCEDEALNADDLLVEMEAISSDIQTITSLSCDASLSCKAKAIGVKACGGPTHYIIYSTVSSEAELDYLIGRYNLLNEKYNKVSGLSSDCSIAYPPALDCVSGNCEIVR